MIIFVLWRLLGGIREGLGAGRERAGRTVFELGMAESGQDLDLDWEDLEGGYPRGIFRDQESRRTDSKL